MDLLTLILTACGLAMDAFAVAVSSGITARDPLGPKALRMGFFFGFFQALMPLIGYFAGMSIMAYIQHVDHFVAFGLLAFVGGKMLLDGIRGEEDCEAKGDSFRIQTPVSYTHLTLPTTPYV